MVAPRVVHLNTNDLSNFFVYEKYESMDALKTHSSTINLILFFRGSSVGLPQLEARPFATARPVLDKNQGLSLVF